VDADASVNRGQFNIHGFTGYAFEAFVVNALQTSVTSKVKGLLNLNSNISRVVGSSYGKNDENQKCQIDIVVRSEDKTVRVIECKWSQGESNSMLEEIESKQIEVPSGLERFNILILGNTPSKAFVELAKKRKIQVIGIEDFFQPTGLEPSI
jgi:hypothetical protein